jgi:hypothetical protein
MIVLAIFHDLHEQTLHVGCILTSHCPQKAGAPGCIHESRRGFGTKKNPFSACQGGSMGSANELKKTNVGRRYIIEIQNQVAIGFESIMEQRFQFAGTLERAVALES